ADTHSDGDCGKPATLRRIRDNLDAHWALTYRISNERNFRWASRPRSFQMPLALSQAVLSRHGGRAPAACCAIAVILVTAWSGISTVALAQSDPLRQPNGQGRMSAPIGHRQP